jgi:lipopolysaccharide/colanic/teichoic acid biosynthesis glycosyltransferase
MDVVGALLALVLFAPIVLLVAVLVRWRMGSPVLFVQERPGLYNQVFRVYKFRTMRDAVDSGGTPLPDEARVTRLGNWLRRTSLDELPELWNVLRGDMSLVGPRPLLTEYLPHYSAEQARRHHVRPGITGWAQINGRNELEWHDRFAMDIWYVDHHSLLLDVKILFLTLFKVFWQEGITPKDRTTPHKFSGAASLSSRVHESIDHVE